MKTLLVLCGGEEAKEVIKIAKRMQLFVIVCDGNSEAPARFLADDFIHASIYHPKEIIEALSEYSNKDKIDGVITAAADNPVSVSEVANFLGLRSLSKETAILSTNKLSMKNKLKSVGILMPWYRGIKSLEELIDIINSRPSEYVLKPVDSRGSRGVIRLNNISQCDKAYNYSIQHSESKKLILEEWIQGNQLSSESIVLDKKAYLCGLADRNYDRLDELYPYVVEDGGQTPSKFSSQNLEKKINQLTTEVCKTVNLDNGSIKGDLILVDDRLYLIEFAARLSGGSFCTYTIPLVYEYNLVENVINIALNQKPFLPPSPHR